MVITLGEDGLVVVGPDEDSLLHLGTTAQEVYDVSGAGDTVAAVLSLGLACGATPSQAGTLANLAAGVVVSEVGTVPIQLERLLATLRNVN